jgi:hypothetical protein
MGLSLDAIINLSYLVIGTGGVIGIGASLLHRGPYGPEKKIYVNVSEGFGVKDIIMYTVLPEELINTYAMLSAPIEHLIGGSGVILALGSLTGIISSLIGDFIGYKSFFTLYTPFIVSSILMLNWEVQTFLRDGRHRKLETGDYLQLIATFGAAIGCLGATYSIFSKLLS